MTDKKAREESMQRDLMQKEEISQLQKVAENQKQQFAIATKQFAIATEQLETSNQLTKRQQHLAEVQDAEIEHLKVLSKQQGRELQQLDNLSLDRNISEIEISFAPSADHWPTIAAALDKMVSPVRGVPYSATSFRAEKIGEFWRIEFDPVEINDPPRAQGVYIFPVTSTKEPKSKGFEDAIREASIHLWVMWGKDAVTQIEPWIAEYPTKMAVSRQSIAFSLRPPHALTMQELRDHPFIKLRSRKYPDRLRVRSLDPGVSFDETFQLTWTRDSKPTQLERRMVPFVSGELPLHVTFRVLKNR